MAHKFPPKSGEKLIAANKKASFRYFFLEKYEAGMALVGREVKSLRDGKVNLGDAYVVDHNGELTLINCHISLYPPASQLNHPPLRSRKLLLHHDEIERLLGKMREKGLALIPTKLYFKKGRVKCEIALAKGKKLHDQRNELREKEHQREMERAIKQSK